MINKLRSVFAPLSLAKKILFAVLTLGCVISIAQLLIFPSRRTGLLGIGLPSQMETFSGKDVRFVINYPSSWVVSELPNGNHGDQEVFASILNPGWWMPSVWFARNVFETDDLDRVAEWGEARLLMKPDDYSSTSLTSIQTSALNGLLQQYTWSSESDLLGQTQIKCEDLYVTNNGIGYAVSFCSEDKDWQRVQEVFQQMMDSFALRQLP
jgi:hypothetical protein